MKKLLTLVLALMMVLGMTAAMADQTATKISSANGNITISENSFTIPKDIVVYNSTGHVIYEPNVTYKYTLTNGTAGALITDKAEIDTYDSNTTSSVTAVVKAGVTDGVKLSSTYTTNAGTTALLKFGQDSTETAASTQTNEESVLPTANDVKKITRNLTVTIEPTAFKQGNNLTPGVYRYVITETAAETEYPLSESGLTRTESYSTNKLDTVYLDVYLKWTNNEMTALECYGVVLFHSTDGANGFIYSSEGTDTSKITGFDVASQGNDVDTYHTWNLTVEKKVTGGMGDRNHLFPFGIIFSGSAAKTAQFSSEASTGNNGTNTALALTNGALEINSGLTTTTMALKDGGTVTFYGLPTDVKALIKEKNDTVDYYTASAKNDKHTGTEAYTLKNNDDAPVSANSVAVKPSGGIAENSDVFQMIAATTANATGNNYQANKVTFTNNLDAVSPTGYITRFAPYALILVAGVALMIVAMKKRKTSDED